MPKIDFNDIPENDDFNPIPEGKYLCRLEAIEEKSTKKGDEMWSLRLEVQDGEYNGRVIFDNMVFSSAAMKRVKLICSRMGIDTSGEVDLSPADLQGRMVIVETVIEEYTANDGSQKKRNTVPFAGYHKYDGDAGTPVGAGGEGDELPF